MASSIKIRLLRPTTISGTDHKTGTEILLNRWEARRLITLKRATEIHVQHTPAQRKAAERAAIPDDVIKEEAIRRGFMPEHKTKTTKAKRRRQKSLARDIQRAN